MVAIEGRWGDVVKSWNGKVGEDCRDPCHPILKAEWLPGAKPRPRGPCSMTFKAPDVLVSIASTTKVSLTTPSTSPHEPQLTPHIVVTTKQPTMTSDPLNSAAVLEGMANALPTHEKDDTTSDLSSSLDCIALFVHACMVNLGFRLLGFNEDNKNGSLPLCRSPCLD